MLDARKCRFFDGEVLRSARYRRERQFLVENEYLMEGKTKKIFERMNLFVATAYVGR
ncbi:unnamed protein product [Ixodes persulcatus]